MRLKKQPVSRIKTGMVMNNLQDFNMVKIESRPQTRQPGGIKALKIQPVCPKLFW